MHGGSGELDHVVGRGVIAGVDGSWLCATAMARVENKTRTETCMMSIVVGLDLSEGRIIRPVYLGSIDMLECLKRKPYS